MNIENKEFKSQYHKFLLYLTEKGEQNLEDEDRLVLVFYLLLQERIQESMEVFKKI